MHGPINIKFLWIHIYVFQAKDFRVSFVLYMSAEYSQLVYIFRIVTEIYAWEIQKLLTSKLYLKLFQKKICWVSSTTAQNTYQQENTGIT